MLLCCCPFLSFTPFPSAYLHRAVHSCLGKSCLCCWQGSSAFLGSLLVPYFSFCSLLDNCSRFPCVLATQVGVVVHTRLSIPEDNTPKAQQTLRAELALFEKLYDPTTQVGRIALTVCTSQLVAMQAMLDAFILIWMLHACKWPIKIVCTRSQSLPFLLPLTQETTRKSPHVLLSCTCTCLS